MRRAVAALLAGQTGADDILEAALLTEFPSFVAVEGVGALIYSKARELGLEERLALPVRKALRKEYASLMLLEDLRLQELKLIAEAFQSQSIRCLTVKGTGLAYTLYDEPHLRRRGDTDLLIPEGERSAARKILEGLGYTPNHQLPGELALYQVEYLKPSTPGFRMAIDLHWRLSNQEVFSNKFRFEELWSEAQSLPQIGIPTLGQVDGLLLALVHRVAHHNRSRALLWLYDIFLLARALSPAEQDRFRTQAIELEILQICRDGLEQTRQEFPALEIDRLVEALPQATREPGDRFLKDATNLQLLWSDFSALSWPNRVRWLREQLLPPLDYMRWRYGTRNPLKLAFCYVQRIASGIWSRSRK